MPLFETADDFTSAVYSVDDQPIQIDLQTTAAIVALSRQVCVKSTSSKLTRLRSKTPSSGSLSSPQSTVGKTDANPGSLMEQLAMLFHKAKKMDASAPVHIQIQKPSDAQPKSYSQKAPPAVCDQEPGSSKEDSVPEKPLLVQARELGEKSSPDGSRPGKSLEDYELDAYKKLESKKGCKLLKRPASKSQPAKKAKAKPTCAKKQSASSGWPEKVVYGCIRCRGSCNGCDTCRKPRFRGLKLPGRAAWVQWARENGKL